MAMLSIQPDGGAKRNSSPSQDEMAENQKYALSLRLPEFAPASPRKDRIAIIAGGHSLHDQIENIRSYKGRLIALNGAHNFLLERNIVPHALTIIDPKPENIAFVAHTHPEIEYWISAFCHSGILQKLVAENRSIKLWFPLNGDTWKDGETFKERRGRYYLPAKGSVGCATLYLLWMLGYRNFDLFGYDSCHTQGHHHAYEQIWNEGFGHLTMQLNGHTFVTEHSMIIQCQNITAFVRARPEIDLIVHGGGLLKQYLSTGKKESK